MRSYRSCRQKKIRHVLALASQRSLTFLSFRWELQLHFPAHSPSLLGCTGVSHPRKDTIQARREKIKETEQFFSPINIKWKVIHIRNFHKFNINPLHRSSSIFNQYLDIYPPSEQENCQEIQNINHECIEIKLCLITQPIIFLLSRKDSKLIMSQ